MVLVSTRRTGFLPLASPNRRSPAATGELQFELTTLGDGTYEYLIIPPSS
jgi:hypothetical protein